MTPERARAGKSGADSAEGSACWEAGDTLRKARRDRVSDRHRDQAYDHCHQDLGPPDQLIQHKPRQNPEEILRDLTS